MDEDYSRPYIDSQGRLVYLTDEEAAGRRDVRRLQPGETVPRMTMGEIEKARSSSFSDSQKISSQEPNNTPKPSTTILPGSAAPWPEP